MEKQAGIWIDHKEAFVVFIDEGARQSHVKNTTHAAAHEGQADDQRQRQVTAHLATYYDEVMSLVDGAESVFIIGPGEAKGELEKRFTTKGLGKRVVGVEAADKMTEHQIAARVRAHYQK